MLFQYSDDPKGLKINVEEEDVLKRYPLDYEKLTLNLRKKYSDFKADNKYHKIRKELAKNKKLCRTRHLDPNNPKSPKKDFYNTEIIKEFDKHYTKK